MPPPSYGGPSLPRNLLDQVGGSSPQSPAIVLLADMTQEDKPAIAARIHGVGGLTQEAEVVAKMRPQLEKTSAS